MEEFSIVAAVIASVATLVNFLLVRGILPIKQGRARDR